nr:MAG TPA: tail tube protein [Caudoviricetes sp.]
MKALRAGDTISGQEGKAYIEVDGEIKEFFYVKTIEATFEKNKSELKTLGHRGTQNKATGWTGKGSMTIYYVSSLFRRMALEYAKTGKDVYFTLLIENEDPTSSAGKQTVALYDCNLDSTILAKLDVDSDALEEDADFTFGDFDILQDFKEIKF